MDDWGVEDIEVPVEDGREEAAEEAADEAATTC
jgi:hypothetical protein